MKLSRDDRKGHLARRMSVLKSRHSTTPCT